MFSVRRADETNAGTRAREFLEIHDSLPKKRIRRPVQLEEEDHGVDQVGLECGEQGQVVIRLVVFVEAVHLPLQDIESCVLASW